MPWETTDVMDQTKRMIEQWQSGRYSKAELARRFGVSRTTVYEWIGRFNACGCRKADSFAGHRIMFF